MDGLINQIKTNEVNYSYLTKEDIVKRLIKMMNEATNLKASSIRNLINLFDKQ